MDLVTYHFDILSLYFNYIYLYRYLMGVILCRWLPRSAFRPAEGELADCVLVVGVSRPKLAAALLSVTLLSLFLTFHVLYDSALYSIHVCTNYC